MICAMAFARSSGSVGSCAAAGIAIARIAPMVTAIRYEVFTGTSLSEILFASTILRARRKDFSSRQCHGAQQTGFRTVSRTAGFSSDGLADRGLDITLVDFARAEKAGGWPLQ